MNQIERAQLTESREPDAWISKQDAKDLHRGYGARIWPTPSDVETIPVRIGASSEDRDLSRHSLKELKAAAHDQALGGHYDRELRDEISRREARGEGE